MSEQTENLMEQKGIEASIVSKLDAIQETTRQATQQAKDAGDANQETKSKLESLMSDYNGLYDRVQAVEQNGVKLAEGSGGYDLGAEFVKTEQFGQLQAGNATSAKMNIKTAIINATGQNQPLVQSDRLVGINTTPNRVLTIRDILPASTTSSNLIEFVRESSFTNNAGPTISGSPEAVENVTKPESAMAFTLATEAVRTLAHFIPASKQVLDDSNELAAFINSRLTYGLKLKEETQLLNGTGINGELNGIITQATAYTVQSPQLTNEIDIIREMIKQAHVAEYRPDAIILNPQDWYDIDVRKVGASDDRYVVGNPAQMTGPTLWGLPVVITNSIASGTCLVGSFGQGAEIKDRQQAAVQVSTEDGNNFTKNMATVLVEERLALAVFRTEAFITGSI